MVALSFWVHPYLQNKPDVEASKPFPGAYTKGRQAFLESLSTLQSTQGDILHVQRQTIFPLEPHSGHQETDCMYKGRQFFPWNPTQGTRRQTACTNADNFPPGTPLRAPGDRLQKGRLPWEGIQGKACFHVVYSVVGSLMGIKILTTLWVVILES